jgi:hypothetical protein
VLASTRAGGALLLAVMLVALTAVATGAILTLSTATSGRQSAAVDNKRSFYLAEAGLSEAYSGLGAGFTGHLGTSEQPAAIGEGLVWVEASLLDEQHLRLRSSALCGKGRAALEIIVERVELPVGFFSDDPLELDAPFLLDGWDSGEGSYADQATEGAGATSPSTYLDPVTGVVLEIDHHAEQIGEAGVIQVWELPTDHAAYLPFSAVVILGVYPEGFVEDYLAATGYTPPAGGGEPPAGGGSEEGGALGVHTAGGGLLGSNGDITLTHSALLSAEIWGDVQPGVDAALAGTASVSGLVAPRTEALVLPSVVVPDVELQAAVDVADGAQLNLPAGTLGYLGLHAGVGARIIVRGPATLVVGDLRLDAGAQLLLDNSLGRIEVTVTGAVAFDPSSEVVTNSKLPSDLLFSVAGESPAALEGVSEFYGLVYAPDALVSIGRTFEVYGVVIARSLAIAPYARLHFDSGYHSEELPKFVGWRLVEVPRELDPDLLSDLALDPAAFPSAADAQLLGQYLVLARYSAADSFRRTYKGPLASWDPSDVVSMISIELVPHDFTFSQDWQVDIRYEDWSGSVQVYSGPVPGLPLADVKDIQALVLHPPPDYDEVVYGSAP